MFALTLRSMQVHQKILLLRVGLSFIGVGDADPNPISHRALVKTATNVQCQNLSLLDWIRRSDGGLGGLSYDGQPEQLERRLLA